MQGVRKPYNPIIGETFACYWKHEDGSRSQYFAEQVLHRPPISATYFENRQNGIVSTAHVWTKSQFSAPQTVKSILEGACFLHFLEHDEVSASRPSVRPPVRACVPSARPPVRAVVTDQRSPRPISRACDRAMRIRCLHDSSSAVSAEAQPPAVMIPMPPSPVPRPPPTRSSLIARCLQEYVITFPTYYAHNLLIGTLRMDIGDPAHIVCAKSALRADITFNQMGTFSSADRLHSVEGRVVRIPEGASATTKKAGWFSKGGAAEGELIGTISGHYDKVLFWGDASGALEPLADLTALPVAPKWVLPLSLQGPWESRRLWQFATTALLVRPKVDWDAVDREKAQLEEEQRLVPCHNFKPGAPGYAEWPTKKFHMSKVLNIIDGKEEQLFLFDEYRASLKKLADGGAPEKNLLHLSRTLPDVRGGLHGAGACKRARLPFSGGLAVGAGIIANFLSVCVGCLRWGGWGGG